MIIYLGLVLRKISKLDYIEMLDSIFDYGYYVDNDNIVLKIHFDYLKHHNAMAFPSVIFVDENLSSIQYSITSKHNGEVVKGTISNATEK